MAEETPQERGRDGKVTRRDLVSAAAVGFGALAAVGPQAAGAAVRRSWVYKKASSITVAAVAGTESDPLGKVLGEYKRRAGVRVDLVRAPYSNLFQKLLTNLTSNSDAFDIAFMDDPWLPAFAGGGFLVPLDTLGYKGDDPDYVKQSIAIGKWPTPGSPPVPKTLSGAPRQYAIPIVGNAQFFSYRKDLLQQKGLGKPSTWDDVLRIAKAFEGTGDFGYVIRGATGNPIVTNFSPVLRGFGGDYFDAKWNTRLNDANGLAALNRFLALAQFSPPGRANFDAEELNQTLLDGKGVQALNWPAWGPVLEAPSSKVRGKMGYVTTPAGPAGHRPTMGNWLLGIPKGSKKQADAFAFIMWATSKATWKELAKLGGVPPRKTVLLNPSFVGTHPWYPAIAASLALARFRPRIPNWSEIEDIVGRHLNDALTGAEKPKPALDAAAKEMTAAMKRAGIVK